MKNLKEFNFNGNKLTVFVNEQKEPLFIAKDVCKVLELSNVSKALYNLDEDERTLLEVTHPQNPLKVINVNGISESGFYKLVLRSNKPQAQPFQKWVTSEVLPSIRKHGAYLTGDTLEKVLSNPDLIIGLGQRLKEEKAQKERVLIQNQLQEEQLQIQAPKVQYFNEVLQSKSTYTTNQIAKEFGLSARSLNKILNDLKVQYKQNNTWLLYHKYQNRGYTKTKTHYYYDSLGEQKTSMQTVWTETGRLFLHELLKESHTG